MKKLKIQICQYLLRSRYGLEISFYERGQIGNDEFVKNTPEEASYDGSVRERALGSHQSGGGTAPRTSHPLAIMLH